LPLPEMTAGPHLGYVGQWILIAIFAVAVYVIALRNLPATD
jgi:cytochrome oxidase assembly protein ShyY1